ncbi:hypothetical protein Salat_2597500 [Sesamum alatum]|uniref:Uncharacterized protein n=1 Tax=Sesamum alatum TaxID=300844 RepID=A0AAE2CAL6_9LAMI|nr:hypothetical protein Salat_2597500 [Sesamum alatum]
MGIRDLIRDYKGLNVISIYIEEKRGPILAMDEQGNILQNDEQLPQLEANFNQQGIGECEETEIRDEGVGERGEPEIRDEGVREREESEIRDEGVGERKERLRILMSQMPTQSSSIPVSESAPQNMAEFRPSVQQNMPQQRPHVQQTMPQQRPQNVPAQHPIPRPTFKPFQVPQPVAPQASASSIVRPPQYNAYFFLKAKYLD